MPSTQSSTINLGLAATPEISDPRLFPEFVRLYNAINLLAQTVDAYSLDGTQAQIVTQLKIDFDELKAAYDALLLTGIFGTLKATGAFACNGKEVQAAKATTANASDLTTAIALVNNLKTTLIANGICS